MPAAGPSQCAVSLSEAAARLRVSKVELEAMVAAGKLWTVAVGLTTMVPLRELERWAKQGS